MDFKSIAALWTSAICFTMARPRPVPPVSLEWLLIALLGYKFKGMTLNLVNTKSDCIRTDIDNSVFFHSALYLKTHCKKTPVAK